MRSQQMRSEFTRNTIFLPLIIAQGCLESAWGQSGLAQEGKNLFGIKGTYNGKYVLMWTTEYDNSGSPTRVKAKFRKYPSWYESLQDLAKIYINGPAGTPTYIKPSLERLTIKGNCGCPESGLRDGPQLRNKAKQHHFNV